MTRTAAVVMPRTVVPVPLAAAVSDAGTSVAGRLGVLRSANRGLKQQLAAAIITHDSLQPATPEALEAENLQLRERLAWFTSENVRLDRT